ncbi:MAG: hypothetical protein OXF46_06090 [Rhodobacteraceae bacterium]|nr:hypothetical protein [Paracoccaceae bacterium]
MDIGCGDGELGTFIMEQGATVLGIDSSAEFDGGLERTRWS